MYAGNRFGQDTATRIAASTPMLMEASEQLPSPQYQLQVPFLPPSISNGGGVGGSLPSGSTGIIAGSEGGSDDWKRYPDRLDLHVYQGDDVQVPLYFRDEGNPTLDMSNENGWKWTAQVRMFHRYYTHKLYDFVIESELILPDPGDDPQVNTTLVSLYIPRFYNRYPGIYSWDLYSTSEYEGPEYPKPPEIADEDWPLTDQIKTWIYGYVYVAPRVSQTDYLPGPVSGIPPVPTGPSMTGFVFGPNGRVP